MADGPLFLRNFRTAARVAIRLGNTQNGKRDEVLLKGMVLPKSMGYGFLKIFIVMEQIKGK